MKTQSRIVSFTWANTRSKRAFKLSSRRKKMPSRIVFAATCCRRVYRVNVVLLTWSESFLQVSRYCSYALIMFAHSRPADSPILYSARVDYLTIIWSFSVQNKWKVLWERLNNLSCIRRFTIKPFCIERLERETKYEHSVHSHISSLFAADNFIC